MTVSRIPTAVSSKSSPARGTSLASVRDVEPGQPFPVADERGRRYIRPAPPHIMREKIEADLRLNRSAEDEAADDLWLIPTVFGLVVFLGGFAFWLGGVL